MKHFLIIAGAVVAGLLISHFFFNEPSADKSDLEQSASEVVETKKEDQSEAATPKLVSSSSDGAKVYFLELKDGDIVNSPIQLKFGIENMQVVSAGDMTENSGHHHLLINYDELPDMTQPLPASDTLIHFGGGQTETSIELEPGQYSLQLVLGNWAHVPHDPPVMSDKINITVE